MKHLFTFGLLLTQALLYAQAPLQVADYLKQHQIEATYMKEGFYYQVKAEGQGNRVRVNDIVKAHFKIINLVDSTVIEQSMPDFPEAFVVGYGQVIRGIDLGVQMMRPGSRVDFYLPPELAYGKEPNTQLPHANIPVKCEVHLLEILDNQAYDAYMRQIEEQERITFEKEQQAQAAKDAQLIKDYLATKKWKAQYEPSGLAWVVTKKGKGQNARPGNVVSITYGGQFLDDTWFAKPEVTEPFTFLLGQGKSLQGWEIGLQYFNKGAEGWLLIPSALGYGAHEITTDNFHIPANTVLIFKIKVLNIH